MKVLFCMAYPGYLRYYDGVIHGLAERGHDVYLAWELPHKQREGLLAIESASPLIHDLHRVPSREDSWQPVLRAVRRVSDYLRYLDPRFAGAEFLRSRVGNHLPRGMRWLRRWSTLPGRRSERLVGGMLALERSVPPAMKIDAWLEAIDPDVVVLTPLLTDASRLTDVVKSAHKRGVRVVMGVASWDHLTTKGLIRHLPERVLVWNETQREEAIALHRIPEDRVTVTGAQPFDRWFAWKRTATRRQFAQRVGLGSEQPFILFVGSTASIAAPDAELGFVRRWISALRAGGHPSLASVPVLVRPHPYNPGVWPQADLSDLGDVAVWPRGLTNIVDSDNRQDYFHSLAYSAAVVGINTSAFLEAAVIGRPVLTIREKTFEATQDGTLHFQYLLPENGGPLMVATSLTSHVAQLADVVANPTDAKQRSEAFVRQFVRPHGRDRDATPLVINAIEREAAQGRRSLQRRGAGERLLAPITWSAGVGLALIDEDDQRRLGHVGRRAGVKTAAVAREAARRAQQVISRA